MLSGSKYDFIVIFAVTDEEKPRVADTAAIAINKQISFFSPLNRTMSLKSK